MTTAIDNLVSRGDVAPVPYPIDTAGTVAAHDIKQGDMLWMDTSNKYVLPLDTDAHAAYFCGVAGDGSFIQSYAPKVYADQIPVRTKGTFRFKTTVGETYYDGQSVYGGADAQTVSEAAGVGSSTYPVGVVKLSPGQTSLLAAAGFVEVQINPRFPALSF